ncbi:hypothetical protein DL769_008744 [Monosporascus sp. CRB-8-3]|nr:hypothetical protein DL769_008744 [Monosporascus sp. CRB-8-3]
MNSQLWGTKLQQPALEPEQVAPFIANFVHMVLRFELGASPFPGHPDEPRKPCRLGLGPAVFPVAVPQIRDARVAAATTATTNVRIPGHVGRDKSIGKTGCPIGHICMH